MYKIGRMLVFFAEPSMSALLTQKAGGLFCIWCLLMVRIKHTSTKYIIQGMVDGSASKPALRQDTSYMVEKTYHDIAPCLGAFGAYIMPQ